MIQRIQSAYLLMITVICALALFLPVINVTIDMNGQPQHYYLILSKGLVNTADQTIAYVVTPLMVSIALFAVFSLVCLFMYGNRVRQMRMVRALIFCLAAQVLTVFSWPESKINDFAGTAPVDIQYTVITYFIPLTLVLGVLAFRAIKKDEELVRSADRIR